ncbi:MAG TPA: hypothetical protein VHD56_16165 [Tepidisphaeraceae bacterium]|nr:hypothetical protein [Tepidisphaeraceae bacterium]
MNPTDPQSSPPPRAFTQGVGTVFQFVGVISFLIFFLTCCLSGVVLPSNTSGGWGPYTTATAISATVLAGITFGLALASIGLGLQAQRRNSPAMAITACAIATIFWPIHAIFFITVHLWILTAITVVLTLVFAALLLLSINAYREMKLNPPPIGQEILGLDYKIPYSHLHQDPPEVRLARELAERRRKLESQQKELEMLEQKLHRKTNNPEE